jgi:hypothetical protein
VWRAAISGLAKLCKAPPVMVRARAWLRPTYSLLRLEGEPILYKRNVTRKSKTHCFIGVLMPYKVHI